LADKNARLLSALCLESGAILVVEPGIPRCGEFIAALRTSLIDRGRPPIAPCPHTGPCPFPGHRAFSADPAAATGKGSAKWCHFAFETEDAPQALHRLSAAAGIPKERAVLSFLLAGPLLSTEFSSDDTKNRTKKNPIHRPESFPVRIISDPFPIPSGYGRYGCSPRGAVLLAGTRRDIEEEPPGTLLRLSLKPPEQRDPKSGALIVPYNRSRQEKP
jgi:hypothetical protein